MSRPTGKGDPLANRRVQVALLAFGLAFVVAGVPLRLSNGFGVFLGALLLLWGLSAIGFALLGILGRRH